MEQANKKPENEEKRISGEFARAIVIGSIAFFLGKLAVEEHSHKWTIYLRGLENEDLSYFIRKVVFTLHPSCSEPVVTVEEPPFQVTQTGWGEFQAKIQIFFIDTTERVLEAFHLLKLYPAGAAQSSNANLLRKPVVHEQYDEIVFTDPTESFYKALMAGPQRAIGENKAALDKEIAEHFTKISEVQSMEKIRAAQSFVELEIRKTLDEIEELKSQIEEEKVKSFTTFST